jgi:hypothetical protein
VSINDFLFIALCLVAVLTRSHAGVAFCCLYLLHMLVQSYLGDVAYYGALILIDSAVAMSICAIKQPSRNAIAVAVCSGVFLVINCAGLVMWWLYISPAAYDLACSAAYLLMISALIKMRPTYERKRGGILDLDHPVAGVAVRQGVGMHHQNGGEK